MKFKKDDLVKIDSSIIPIDAKDEHHCGELGIPAVFARHAIFKVNRISVDESRGDVVFCTLTNPDIFKSVIHGVKEVQCEGEVILLTKEIELCKNKHDVFYVIESTRTTNDLISDLFKERKELQSSGLDKRHREMRDNWKKIRVLRGEIESETPLELNDTIVYLPKQKVRLVVPSNKLPTLDPESVMSFKKFLINEVRSIRKERKNITKQEKTILGYIKAVKQHGVYLKENTILEAYKEMLKTTLDRQKKPIDAKANYVGIEIEFSYTGNYEELKRLLIENKLHKYVCLKEDGSIRACYNTLYKTKELTMICKDTEVQSVLSRLNKVLLNPLIDAYANRSCGLHVHLDVRNRNPDLVYKNLVRIQDILRGSQPIGRLKNIYCKPNITDRLDKESIIETGGSSGRYWVINSESYAKHKSIEVRVHEGTTNCDDIFNWVSLLNAVASYTKEIPMNNFKYAQQLVSEFNIEIPNSAIDYVDKRIEKFNSLMAI